VIIASIGRLISKKQQGLAAPVFSTQVKRILKGKYHARKNYFKKGGAWLKRARGRGE